VSRELETKAHYSLTPPTNGTGDVTSTPGTNSQQKANLAMSNIIAVPLNKLTRSAIFDPTLLPLDLHLRGEKNAGLAETLHFNSLCT
jgi:hypothetical protein